MSQEGTIDRSIWPEIRIVVAMGAGGGLLGWLAGFGVLSTGGSSWWLELLLAILGGAAAGGVGVYVVFNSDTKDFKRCIFLAALCGISWRPVLEAGGILIQETVAGKSVANAKGVVDGTLDALNTVTGDIQVQDISEPTARLVEKLPSIRDSRLRDEATNSTIKAITLIADKRPKDAPQALLMIGQRAEASNSSHIKVEVKRALARIIKEDTRREMRDSAIEALKALE